MTMLIPMDNTTRTKERVMTPFWRTKSVRQNILALNAHEDMSVKVGPASGLFFKSFDVVVEHADCPWLMLKAADLVKNARSAGK